MKFKAYSIAFNLMLITCLACAYAQQRPAADQDNKIVTSTNLVTVNVVVTDRSGRYVKGLRGENFEIYADGLRQQMSHFSSEPAPISLAIVSEIHDVRPERSRAVLAALKQFTGTLRDEDDFFLMAFDKQGSVETGFVPTLEQLLDRLSICSPGGPSSLYDVVYAAAGRLRTKPNLKKALLIVSDGEDNNSITSYDRVRDRLRQFDVQIYTIAISNPAKSTMREARRWVFEDVTRKTGWRPYLLDSDVASGRAVLAEMSQVSGGVSYFPEVENEPELMWICTQIAAELRQQYTIGFYPTNRSTKSRSHSLRIVLDADNKPRRLSLGYRKSYQLEPMRP